MVDQLAAALVGLLSSLHMESHVEGKGFNAEISEVGVGGLARGCNDGNPLLCTVEVRASTNSVLGRELKSMENP